MESPCSRAGRPVSLAEAFRRQAASDLDAYEALVPTTLPVSHRLHYLQMWLEKLCKAYLWLPGTSEEDLRMRHQVVASVLPRLVAERWRRLDAFKTKPDMGAIRAICREIDLLHPQVHDGGRRMDNVEYPWTDDGRHPICTRAAGVTGKARLEALRAEVRATLAGWPGEIVDWYEAQVGEVARATRTRR